MAASVLKTKRMQGLRLREETEGKARSGIITNSLFTSRTLSLLPEKQLYEGTP